MEQHGIILENREKMSVSGIAEVENFSDEIITLKTGEDRLTIKGENLHICNFSAETGDFSMTGKVIGLVYSGGKKNTLKGRLFK